MATRSMTNVFEFTQESVLSTWVIEHGLHSVTPIVSVWCNVSGSLTLTTPTQIVYNSDSQLTITLSVARSGVATIVV